MAKKKADKSSKTEQKLQRANKKLRRRLDTSESAAKQWRGKAKKQKSKAEAANAELAELRQRLENAAVPEPSSSSVAAPAPSKRPATKAPAKKAAKAPAKKAAKAPAKEAAKAPAKKAPANKAAASPDATWTVAALRAEARSRGITGYSGRTKAQLLADLRR